MAVWTVTQSSCAMLGHPSLAHRPSLYNRLFYEAVYSERMSLLVLTMFSSNFLLFPACLNFYYVYKTFILHVQTYVCVCKIKHLELINTFNRVAYYNVNISKSIAFTYDKDKLLRNKSEKLEKQTQSP